MKLSVIEKLLEKYPSFTVISSISDADISAIHLINDDDICNDEQILYVGFVQKAQLFAPNVTILSIGISTIELSQNNVFSIDEKELTQAINDIGQIIFEEQKNENDFNKIMYMLVNHSPLHDAVNCASTFLGRSLVLTDLSFKVIDHSTDTPVTDPLWIHNIERGYCSRDFISAINELLPTDSMPVDSVPFKVNCDVSSENKLCTKLIYQNQHIGYLILLDNELGLLPYHYDYLPRIGSLLVEFLRVEPAFDTFFAGVAEGILINLLEGEDPNVSKQRLFASRIEFPDSIRCVIFSPENNSNHTKAFLIKSLKETFNSGIFFTYGSFIVAIINAESLHILQQMSPTDDILAYSNEIGISSLYTDIGLFPLMFRQAARACHLSHHINPGHQLCMYEDYRFYDLLNSCSDKQLLEDNIHSAFGTLYAYDLKKDASLLPTLKCYLSNNMNNKKTADELFLHRNTLKYRLDKIQELTGVDFDDPETKFQLQLSDHINLILKKF